MKLLNRLPDWAFIFVWILVTFPFAILVMALTRSAFPDNAAVRYTINLFAGIPIGSIGAVIILNYLARRNKK